VAVSLPRPRHLRDEKSMAALDQPPLIICSIVQEQIGNRLQLRGRVMSRQETHSSERNFCNAKQILDAEPSAVLRDQLAAVLGEINSTEEAANWAYRVLGAKNSLTAADAAWPSL
jgi:hypothetical protein